MLKYISFTFLKLILKKLSYSRELYSKRKIVNDEQSIISKHDPLNNLLSHLINWEQFTGLAKYNFHVYDKTNVAGLI